VFLTNATKLDASDVMSQTWFCCHFNLSFFWLRMEQKMLASKSWHLTSHFKPENGNVELECSSPKTAELWLGRELELD